MQCEYFIDLLQASLTFHSFLRFIAVPDQYKELVAAKMANSWKLKGYKDAKRTSRYEDFMNGVFSYDSIRTNSIGLDDDEEVDEEPPEIIGDSAERTASWSDSKVIQNSETMTIGRVSYTFTKSFEDENDLIDRQIEAACPELCADHHKAVEEDNWDERTAESIDIWDKRVREESPCPTRASSLNTFVKELFEVADKCSPAPPTACVDDWKGPRWRSVTPFRPANALRTEATTKERRAVVIDLSGETDEESCDEGKEVNK